MRPIFIRGTKKDVNDNLNSNKDIRTIEYSKKVERHAMLSECETGVDINFWVEYDSQKKPIINSYGVYNKLKNKIE